MEIIDHAAGNSEVWRPGVVTRMRVSSTLGADALCIFEQWCAPGTGAPAHSHTVEEVLTVMGGEMEIVLGNERGTMRADHSIVVPAGAVHSFRNCGSGELHVLAILSAPHFEATRAESSETTVRWMAQSRR